jgi:two-component system OmpR family response regulator
MRQRGPGLRGSRCVLLYRPLTDDSRQRDSTAGLPRPCPRPYTASAAPSGRERKLVQMAILRSITAVMNEVCIPTVAGQGELRGGATVLSAHELELLVRLDGKLTLAQISAGMPHVTAPAFASAVASLLDRGLLQSAAKDAFAARMDAQLQLLAQSSTEAAADTGASSLRKAGYFVGIAKARPARQRQPGEPMSAILVEDEPNLARFIQSYLAYDGFKVRLAGNRAEVVAEFSKLPVPDLILLDVALPDVDGFDILLRLRQHPVLKEVPAIMLTAQATREAVLKGMAAGADGYITKPFEADALMRAVRTVLGQSDQPSPAASADPWIDRDASRSRSQ